MSQFPSREDVEKLVASRAAVIVVCRHVAAQPPPPPGTKRGYFCAICHAECEATPAGQAAIAGGGLPFCGPCGIGMAERVERAGLGLSVATTPTAEGNIERGAPMSDRVNRLRTAYPWKREP